MKAAPPVEVVIGSGRRERVVLVMVWATAGLALGIWGAAWLEWPVSDWTASILGAGCAGPLGWSVTRPMQGRLAWDGKIWTWHSESPQAAWAAPGLCIALDLGGWLLLRDDAGRWCGIDRLGLMAQWHGVRLALHASVRGENTP